MILVTEQCIAWDDARDTLQMPRYARAAGLCAIVFLVRVFPGNVYAALNRVPTGGHEAGPAYLLVRAPFRVLPIAWAYWFAVRQEPGR